MQDVVEANLLAATTSSGFGDCFNIGGGHNHSVNETTKLILDITKSSITPTHGPAVIEPKNTLANIAKAKSVLGWEPKTDFEDGLKKTYEYFATLLR